jgi:CrcB protein
MPSSTPHALGTLVWVFLAGGVGATLRVVLGSFVDARVSERLPHAGTLVVNLIGCFVIGVIAVALPPGTLRTAVVGGLLGGFTTYSAFALFSYELLRDERIGVLALQIGLHLALGVGCVAAGVALGRMVVPGAGGP